MKLRLTENEIFVLQLRARNDSKFTHICSLYFVNLCEREMMTIIEKLYCEYCLFKEACARKLLIQVVTTTRRYFNLISSVCHMVAQMNPYHMS